LEVDDLKKKVGNQPQNENRKKKRKKLLKTINIQRKKHKKSPGFKMQTEKWPSLN